MALNPEIKGVLEKMHRFIHHEEIIQATKWGLLEETISDIDNMIDQITDRDRKGHYGVPQSTRILPRIDSCYKSKAEINKKIGESKHAGGLLPGQYFIQSSEAINDPIEATLTTTHKEGDDFLFVDVKKNREIVGKPLFHSASMEFKPVFQTEIDSSIQKHIRELEDIIFGFIKRAEPPVTKEMPDEEASFRDVFEERKRHPMIVARPGEGAPTPPIQMEDEAGPVEPEYAYAKGGIVKTAHIASLREGHDLPVAKRIEFEPKKEEGDDLWKNGIL